MHLPRPTAFTVLFGLTCALSTSSSAQVKFEEQVLVADAATAGLTLSPAGVRVAAVIAKGSRQAVVHEGVEGPRFDQIMHITEYRFSGQGGRVEPRTYVTPGAMGVLHGLAPGGNRQVLFSDDGQHWAYVGRSGDELALMLDGQEIHRGAYQQFAGLAFSPRGARLVAIAVSVETGLNCIVIDGQAGPWGADTSSLCFTADGAHYAYAGQENDAHQARWMVVDGRQVKHVGDIVGFAATGTLFTRTTANYNHVLLANGKALAQGQSFDYLALNGTRLVLAVTPAPGNPPQPKPRVLTVDGQVIAGTEDVNVSGSWFSPDGKRYAVLCQRYSPRMETFMIVDGKKELSYQSIYTTAPYAPSFSPDSSKFLYVAMSPASQIFIVVNGEESDGLQMIGTDPVWSPTGSRLAWGGTTPTQAQLFMIDGQRVPLLRNAQPGPTFRFSPDGARTFWYCGGPNALSLVVDGQELPGVAGLGFVGAEAVDGQYAALRFSPDGQHIAYAARDAATNSRHGLWVDGKLISPASRPQMTHVTFTPDSQHVAWAMAGLKDNVGVNRVFIDGREALAYSNSSLDNLPSAWEMGADGVLTLLGVEGGALKRYRIPPPTDSNITSMLAAAN